MDDIEFNDAQMIWKLIYARNSFHHVTKIAQYIYDSKLETESHLFLPLITSLYTLYARPFTNGNGVGMLKESFVPKELRQIHKEMYIYRNKIYAHKDSKSPRLGDICRANEVRIKVHGRKLEAVTSSEFYVHYTFMPEVINLCERLSFKAQMEEDTLVLKTHRNKIPINDGEYLLNVEDKEKDMWIATRSLLVKKRKHSETASSGDVASY